jgi:hypothetical protein
LGQFFHISLLEALKFPLGGAGMGKKRMTFWMEEKQIEEFKALSLATRIK